MKWLKLWDKTVFGRGQDKKSKLKPEQMKKQKFNSAKNFKKQQTKGVQDEADWNVSTISSNIYIHFELIMELNPYQATNH